MKKIFTLLCVLLGGTAIAHAQFSLTTIGTAVTEDFQSFQGNGCSPTPAAGQLDSKTYAIYGMTNGGGAGGPVTPNDLPFGDTAFVGDLARAYRYSPVVGGGLYAYNDTLTGVKMMWYQPTGGDFTPGELWVRVSNNTGAMLTDVQFDYDFSYFNDGPRSQNIDFEYSSDSVNFISLSADTTLGAADATLYTAAHTHTVSGLAFANNTSMFFRWITNDRSGQGARDEIGFDNISITPLPVSTSSTIAFVGASASISEIGGSINVDIQQNIAVACSVDVNVSGTATNGTDYSYTSLVVFDGTSTSFALPVTILDDILVEPNEDVIMTLANPTGTCLVSANTYTLTILDDDTPSEISFPQATANINEAVGTASFTLNQTIAKPCSVEVAIYGGSATAPADFTFSSPYLVVFDGISTTSPAITIPVIDDALVEGNENAMFMLQNATAGCINGANDSLTVNIQDNDFPTYPIGTITTVNAVGSPDSLNVVCHISGVVHGVNYRLSANGLQFVVADATGSIWAFAQTNAVGYTVTEGDQVTMQGAVIQGNGTTQFRIDSLTVTATAQPLMAVTTVTAFDETVEADLLKVDMVKFINPAAWTPTPGGFSMQATNNVDTFEIRIDNDVDLYNLPAPTCKWMNITGLLQQFDTQTPFLTGYRLAPRYETDIECMPDPAVDFVNSTNSVLENVGTINVTVTIVNPNPDPTDVTFSTTGTATLGTDYTLTPSTVTFPGNSSTPVNLAINVIDDATFEPAETIILTIASATNNATISTTTSTITIAESDVVSIAPALAKEAISLYPNPGSSSFSIQTSENVKAIKVINALGQTVATSTTTHVETAALTSGIYHIQVETTNGVWNGKWVKE